MVHLTDLVSLQEALLDARRDTVTHRAKSIRAKSLDHRYTLHNTAEHSCAVSLQLKADVFDFY